MRTFTLYLVLGSGTLYADATGPSAGSILASRIATQPTLVSYATNHQGRVVARIDGIPIEGKQGIDLTIRSEHPTQLRLIIAGSPHPRFRYLVFSKAMLERRLRVGLSGFDPDPDAMGLGDLEPGTLLIEDAPGFLRPGLENNLAVGPLVMLVSAPSPSQDEIAPGPETDEDPIFRRLLGGWIGKIAGGEAGMPYEGRLGHEASIVPDVEKGLPSTTWGFGPDDDSSFEAMHLIVARESGPAFGPQDLIRSWLRRFSPEYLWKTERYALSAMEQGVFPPESGEGPLGESLCARIRADLWGYLCPGRPLDAIELVGRDAPISNHGEGIRAAEFTAAAIALAFEGGSVEDLIEATLAVQPVADSGHSRVVRACLEDFRAGKTIADAYARLRARTWDPIHERDSRNAWAYALPNAGLTTLALLYGRGDFSRTVALAASLGWDTDCNAATAGSILGVLQTDAGIPASFKEPLHDRLRVAIAGREHWSLRRLAQETRLGIEQFRTGLDESTPPR